MGNILLEITESSTRTSDGTYTTKQSKGFMSSLGGFFSRKHLFEILSLDFFMSVLSCSRTGGDGTKGMDGGIVFLASCEHHFFRVHENRMQPPGNLYF